MEGIGAEVSQKIRSAIKAKLMELGAYVDEELPDYIMVMVANKRSIQQMEHDLDLFLGDNAAVFTTWLHQVLSKLQEVTVSSLDNKKSAAVENVDKKKKPEVSEEPRKEKEKKKKAKKEKEDEKHSPKSKTKDSGLKQEDKKADPTVDIDSNAVQNSDVQPIRVPANPEQSSAHGKPPPVPKSTSQPEEDDDDFINLKADAETDLWEGDTEDMSVSDIKDSDNQKVVPKYSESTKQDASQEQTKVLPRIEAPAKESEPMDLGSSGKSGAEKNSSGPPPSARPAPASRIIKISEKVLRDEKDTLNSSLKRNLDDKRQSRRPEGSETSEKKAKTAITPIVFSADDQPKEDDEATFGKHIANELRLLTPRRRSLAKLKIQQVLYECQESREPRLQSFTDSSRRRKLPPRRAERSDRQRSPVRPPEKPALALRRPLERKRSPIRLGSMRMDSPAYNRAKPKMSPS